VLRHVTGPMIETVRLFLRPMRADDQDELLATFGDPCVMAVFGAAPFGPSEMKRWIDRNLEHQERYGYGLFSVLHKADRRLIGDCGLEHREIGDAPEVELGYDLCSDYWNQGLATEAATAVRDYAFGDLQLPRLVSLIRQGNTASARVAEKVGMRREAGIVQGDIKYWVYAVSHEEGLKTS
jgi:ribosomal-protein-alanine N-acetyltransferase